jgi:hypothetical protein
MPLLICLDIAMPWNLCRRDCVVRVAQYRSGDGCTEAHYRSGERKHMEKVALLCLIVATIGALAEFAPIARRQRD